MPAETAPLIVSAWLGGEDFAWLDGLRRTYYPPDRNRLPAHLTLFRHLPPSIAPELRSRLADACRAPRPAAEAVGFLDLDGGTAVRVISPALLSLRADLADVFAGSLTPQDRSDWRPHVTIQNKVSVAEGRALAARLAATFTPRRLRIEGLACSAYQQGLWTPISRHMFRG